MEMRDVLFATLVSQTESEESHMKWLLCPFIKIFNFRMQNALEELYLHIIDGLYALIYALAYTVVPAL